MSSTPSLLTRSTGLVDMMIRTNPNVLRYRFRGHNNLDGAFFGSVEMFVAEKAKHYLSPSLQESRDGVVEDSKRGMTRITFNPDDFGPLSPSLPTDQEVLYLRVEDWDLALAGYLPPGQIMVIPPPSHFGVQDSVITLPGTAPGGTGAAGGALPPPGVMSIALPLYGSSGEIRNLDVADSLLVSFSEGMPMLEVPAGESLPIYDGSIVEIFLASSSVNGVSFSASISLTKV